MQIVCPQCEAWYEVPDNSAGRTVRCARCRTTWSAQRSIVHAFAAEAVGEPAAPAPTETPPATPAPRYPREPDEAVVADRAPLDEPQPPEPAIGGGAREAATARPEAFDEIASDPVLDAPSVVPDAGHQAAYDDPAPDARPRADAKPDGGRDASKPKRPTPAGRPRWGTVILGMLVVIGVILAWRGEVVRTLPQTAALFARIGLPVNLRGLSFERITIQYDLTENVPVLIVQGTVVNQSKARVDVPRLRFAIRDRTGAEVHTWTSLPQKSWLGPGEEQSFTTRLASPPSVGSEILVRFFTRRDR